MCVRTTPAISWHSEKKEIKGKTLNAKSLCVADHYQMIIKFSLSTITKILGYTSCSSQLPDYQFMIFYFSGL